MWATHFIAVHTHTDVSTHLASVSNLQGASEKGQQETVKMGDSALQWEKRSLWASFKFPFSPRYPTDTSIAPRSTLRSGKAGKRNGLGKSENRERTAKVVGCHEKITFSPEKHSTRRHFPLALATQCGWWWWFDRRGGVSAISSGAFVSMCVCVRMCVLLCVCVPLLYILFCRFCLITKFSILSHKNICKTSSTTSQEASCWKEKGENVEEKRKKRKILLCILIHFYVAIVGRAQLRGFFLPTLFWIGYPEK